MKMDILSNQNKTKIETILEIIIIYFINQNLFLYYKNVKFSQQNNNFTHQI